MHGARPCPAYLSVFDSSIDALQLELLCLRALQEGQAMLAIYLCCSPATQVLPGMVGKHHTVGVGGLCDDAGLKQTAQLTLWWVNRFV